MKIKGLLPTRQRGILNDGICIDDIRNLKLKLSGDIRMDDLYNDSSLRNNSLNAFVKTWCSPRDIHVLGHAILFLYLAELFLTQN